MFNRNLNMKQSHKSKMEYILQNYRPVLKVSQKEKKSGAWGLENHSKLKENEYIPQWTTSYRSQSSTMVRREQKSTLPRQLGKEYCIFVSC